MALVLALSLPGAAGTQPADDLAANGAPETLLRATLQRTGDTPIELRLLRITLEAGGKSPWHAHPGLEFGVVEAGQLTVQARGTAIRRAAGGDAERGALPEGTEVALAVGDRIAYAPGTEMTFRNPGPERTVLLAATVLPVGPGAPPGAVFREGTPTAAEVAGVRSEVLGSAELEADELPDGRGVVVLERLRLAAGDAVPAFAGPVLLAVDRGRLAGEVEAGSVVVGGRGTPGTPVATTGGFAVDASGAVFFPDGMAETAPLGGDGEAIVLRLGVVPLPLADAVSDGAAEASAATNEPTGAEEDGADGFAPGSRVVVAVDEARLRAEPSLAGALVVGLDGGRVLVVTGEPTAVDGYRWYPVADASDPSLVGYVAGELLIAE